MIIEMKFSHKWIYSGDGTNTIKLRNFYNELSKAIEGKATVSQEGIGYYKISTKRNEKNDEKEIVEKILNLSDKIMPDLPEDCVEILFEAQETEKREGDAGEEKKPTAIDRINDLIGLDDFKKYCNEIALNAGVIKARKSIFFSETLLCSCDEGNGFSENLLLLKKLFSETGLISSDKTYEVNFGSYFDKPESFPVIYVTDSISCLNVFDISGWIGYTNDERFKKGLKAISQSKMQSPIFFKMGHRSKSVIEETLKDINDILNVRLIDFPELTDEQLYAYAEREFEAMEFKPDEKTPEVFKAICDYEKADGLFYGTNTVKKVAREMVRVSIKSGSNQVINSEACRSIVPEREITEDSMKTIENMIGMQEVTRQMKEIVAQVKFSRASGKKSPAMHMFFVGNPGTGKTTVARAIGQIFRENDILRVGKFFENKGRDLCAEYIGQTAVKVNNICKSAYGSVLFIDEAYSLATERDDKDYGKEAIDTLIAEMENHSDDLVVIFAGYPEEMEGLLKTNPGLRSRIPYRIVFPNYTKDELYQIFIKMVENNGYTIEDGFAQHVKDFFLSLPDELLESKQFGNGRFVRNIFERTWGKAILRCAPGASEVPPLSTADFDAATAEFNSSKPESSSKKIGF
ncbi:MAG: AAA family ATPase [Clostridia bacterium]|nr:AAA family ATPase [Clostridia bacterium]